MKSLDDIPSHYSHSPKTALMGKVTRGGLGKPLAAAISLSPSEGERDGGEGSVYSRPS